MQAEMAIAVAGLCVGVAGLFVALLAFVHQLMTGGWKRAVLFGAILFVGGLIFVVAAQVAINLISDGTPLIAVGPAANGNSSFVPPQPEAEVVSNDPSPSEPEVESVAPVAPTEAEIAAVEEPEIDYESELQDAIWRAANVEADAYARLDPSVFYNSYTGRALEQQLATMEEMIANGVYRVAYLENQEFHSFEVSEDGVKAEVYLTETWSSTIYDGATGLCVAQYSSIDVPQTMYLINEGYGWLIEAVVFDDPTTPAPESCF